MCPRSNWDRHHNENDSRIIKLEAFSSLPMSSHVFIVTGYFMILKNELSPPILGAQANGASDDVLGRCRSYYEV